MEEGGNLYTIFQLNFGLFITPPKPPEKQTLTFIFFVFIVFYKFE